MRGGASGMALLAAASAAHAAPPVFRPSLDVRAVATDNAALTPSDQKQSDVIGDVDAAVAVRLQGARVGLNGELGVDFIGYADHTQRARVLPRGRLDLTSTLVERALFFDAGLSASRTRTDPLGPQLEDTSTANTSSTLSLRASPYFQHDFSPTLSASVRSDTVLTRTTGDTPANAIDSPAVDLTNGSTYQRESVRIDRKPVPVGLSVEASREETTYQGTDQTQLRQDTAAATLSAALDPEFIAGVVGGRDHSVYSGVDTSETRYGVVAQWRPSTRTAFNADVEHRYFGTGFNIRLRHRLPLAIFDLSLQRSASASAAAFDAISGSADPAALLNSLLSSRIPDQAARDTAVDQLQDDAGLPDQFTSPVLIDSQSAQLATRGTLNLVINGQRNTLYASTFYAKATALPGSTLALAPTTFDSRQWGASLGLFHRLSPDTSAGAEVIYSNLDALGARAGDSSRQVTGTLSLTRRLGPNTSLSCGLRHFASRIDLATTAGTTSVNENQAFAGLRVQY